LTIPPINTVEHLGVNVLTDPLSAHRLTRIEDPAARAEAVATQLGSLFMGMMVKAMRATVPEGGLLGQGMGGEIYQEMLDEQLASTGGLPHDPSFHEALVRQILQGPGSIGENPGVGLGPSQGGSMTQGQGNTASLIQRHFVESVKPVPQAARENAAAAER
jgi:Rod binding domain-containing protein